MGVIEQMHKTELFEYESKKREILDEEIMVVCRILQDIRHIMLCKIPFKSEVALKNFIRTLPSFEKSKSEESEPRIVAKCTVLAPGEVPDWLKEARARREAEKASSQGQK